jgi:hypothetical protein
MSSVNLKVHFNFEERTVTFLAREPLDVKPLVIAVPFAILKAAAVTLLKAEAEDELTLLQESGDLAEQTPEQKIEVVKG